MIRALAASLLLVLSAGAMADQSAGANAGASAGSQSEAGASAGARSGDTHVLIDQGGNSTVTKNNFPASSPASVFVGNCQTGGAGQDRTGGVSTVFDSSQCQALRQATAEQQLYEFYRAKGDKGMAALHLKRMEVYMAQAADAVDMSRPTKTVGGWLLDLLPIGIVALLL
jgi:hypothetical protein